MIKHIFASSNTDKGIRSLSVVSDKLEQLDSSKLYILKGAFGTGKSSFIKRLANFLVDKGYNVIFYHNPINPSIIDSIFIPNIQILIITTNSMDINSTILPGNLIDFDLFLEKDITSEDRTFILSLFNSVTKNLEKSNLYLQGAKAIYSTCIKTAENGILKNAKRKYENARIKNISQLISEKDKIGYCTYLYSYALTSYGVVDYIHTLISKSKTIYLIRENLICQSKDLMKRLHDLFLHNGYNIICSISPFDENKIEDIIVPELSLSIAVSNTFRKPKIFPTDIFDFNHCVDYEVLDPIANEFDDDFNLFLSLLDKSYNSINNASKNINKIKEYYAHYMNFDKVDELFEILSSKIIE
ncbi:hypothetical protein AN641_08050 [Candidatus Epulonipiscioides gigas]|nr:hypothetical protein AN641_08050 [Epulopiscium sp. SCG-C07WGA-EpuloA2]